MKVVVDYCTIFKPIRFGSKIFKGDYVRPQLVIEVMELMRITAQSEHVK